MVKDVFTFIASGKAGEGAKKTGSVASQIFISIGLHFFHLIEYKKTRKN